MRQFQKIFTTVLVAGTISFIPACAYSQQWYPVKEGKLYGISGMTVLNRSNNDVSFLIVHDNKGDEEEPRIAIVTVEKRKSAQYISLHLTKKDEDPLPYDLEAITSIPGDRETFMAMESCSRENNYWIYHLKLDVAKKDISVIKKFYFPEMHRQKELEGFSLQNINNKIVAIWAYRGNSDEPGKLYWGLFNRATCTFSQINTASVKVPCPETKVRHVSDLRVDSNGVLYITSASDPGDDGPFQSAVYIAGVFSVNDNEIVFSKNAEPVRLNTFNQHKIEAIELIPGACSTFSFASDDEKKGSFIYIDW